MFRSLTKTHKLLSVPFALAPKLTRNTILSFLAKSTSSFQAPISRYSFSMRPASDSADPTLPELIKKGYNHLNTGNVQKAKSSFKSALEASIDQDPIDYDHQSQALVGLGSIHTVMGETKEALKLLHQAEEALTKFEVKDKAILSHLAYLLGRNYRQADKYNEALKYAEDAVRIHKENSTEEDSKVGLMYYNLGVIHRNDKDLEKAKTNFIKAVECFEKDTSSDTSQLFFIYLELGYLLLERQEWASAAQYLEKAGKGVLNDPDMPVATKVELYYNLGKCYRESQDLDRALVSYLKINDLIKGNVKDPAEKAQIAGLTEVTAQDLIELGKFAEAVPVLLRSLEFKKELGTDQSAEAGVICHYLGMAYGYLQDMDKAIKYLEDSIKIKVNALGKEHLEVGFAYQSLGMTYMSVNRIPEAEEALKTTQRIFKANFGEGHPVYGDLQETLGMLGQMQNK